MRVIISLCFILCFIQANRIYADQCNDDCYAAYNSCIINAKDGDELLCNKPWKQCINTCPKDSTYEVSSCRQKCDVEFRNCISKHNEGREFFCNEPVSRCYGSCPLP